MNPPPVTPSPPSSPRPGEEARVSNSTQQKMEGAFATLRTTLATREQERLTIQQKVEQWSYQSLARSIEQSLSSTSIPVMVTTIAKFGALLVARVAGTYYGHHLDKLNAQITQIEAAISQTPLKRTIKDSKTYFLDSMKTLTQQLRQDLNDGKQVRLPNQDGTTTLYLLTPDKPPQATVEVIIQHLKDLKLDDENIRATLQMMSTSFRTSLSQEALKSAYEELPLIHSHIQPPQACKELQQLMNQNGLYQETITVSIEDQQIHITTEAQYNNLLSHCIDDAEQIVQPSITTSCQLLDPGDPLLRVTQEVSFTARGTPEEIRTKTSALALLAQEVEEVLPSGVISYTDSSLEEMEKRLAADLTRGYVIEFNGKFLVPWKNFYVEEEKRQLAELSQHIDTLNQGKDPSKRIYLEARILSLQQHLNERRAHLEKIQAVQADLWLLKAEDSPSKSEKELELQQLLTPLESNYKKTIEKDNRTLKALDDEINEIMQKKEEDVESSLEAMISKTGPEFKAALDDIRAKRESLSKIKSLISEIDQLDTPLSEEELSEKQEALKELDPILGDLIGRKKQLTQLLGKREGQLKSTWQQEKTKQQRKVIEQVGIIQTLEQKGTPLSSEETEILNRAHAELASTLHPLQTDLDPDVIIQILKKSLGDETLFLHVGQLCYQKLDTDLGPIVKGQCEAKIGGILMQKVEAEDMQNPARSIRRPKQRIIQVNVSPNTPTQAQITTRATYFLVRPSDIPTPMQRTSMMDNGVAVTTTSTSLVSNNPEETSASVKFSEFTVMGKVGELDTKHLRELGFDTGRVEEL